MRVLYFAWVRERIGTSEEVVDPPAGVETVADLIGWLAGRSDGHGLALAAPDRLRAALDQAFVPLDTPLGDASEVAIFPPVTGG
ncbi:molybdopterin synthase sulfur carrier subunit [Sphingomonas metalli]|uniref:Molybdopterin synthase sulfur carrier subunit n=1 Tax=Sphingomonas metalli TaxID=1779358 RepID=A0A916WNZ0_9SPHN|nr:molybdopterin converting factor subunit 1 [Sphingomonas metalli]GGB16093.1 molybdopterin synthase sulfur carrier subunit [Sphingomonas metalli]